MIFMCVFFILLLFISNITVSKCVFVFFLMFILFDREDN